MVIVDRHTGGRDIRAELATSATMAVHVDQSGQQSAVLGPATRGVRVSPLLGKLRSLASKSDPVTVEDHGAVIDDGGRRNESIGQQNTSVGPHERMMDFVAALGAVGVDIGRPEVTTVSQSNAHEFGPRVQVGDRRKSGMMTGSRRSLPSGGSPPTKSEAPLRRNTGLLAITHYPVHPLLVSNRSAAQVKWRASTTAAKCPSWRRSGERFCL